MNDITKIIRYSWSLKKYYLAAAALVIITSSLNQVNPFIFKFIVDSLVKHGQGQATPVRALIILLILILTVSLTITFLENIQGYIGDVLGVKLNSLLSERYYKHVLGLPLEYYDNEVAGRITSRLERSINTVSQLITTFTNNFIGFILTAVITLVILAYYAWPVAVLLAVLFPIYIWLTGLSSKHWQAKQEGINHDTDYANGRFIESIGQIRVVKSFVQELAEFNIFHGRRKSILAQSRLQSVEWHKYDVWRRLSLNVIFAFIYAYITLRTFQGRYSLGDFTLLLQLVTQAQFPLFASSFIVDNLQRAQAGSKDFFSVMDIKAAIQDQPDATALEVSRGQIAYVQVSFAYGNGKAVLNDISFNITSGTKLALVGESGEGKTTIANLLLRFYSLSSGKITVDGADITAVTQDSLRGQIGVVFQEPALFSGSVRDNIAYGTPKATKAMIEAAAAAANAEGFIAKLPEGYKTQIGERGVKLSGGQKQRIAIARAILKNPPILILDEATSSLDSKAEHEVQQALDTLMQGRTTIIIAHRLSTIARVDQIIGLRNGQIVERGTPAELAHGDGIYAELLALQAPTEVNKAKLKKYELAS